MKLFTGLLAPFQKKSSVMTVQATPIPVEGARSYADVPVNEPSVLSLSAAWACVNLHAGTVGSLPLMIYRTDSNGNRQVARDHPLYRLLHDSPNFDQTALDFWEGGQAALEMRGSMIARKEYFGKRLVALLPVYNPWVSREQNGSIRYRWTEGGKSYDEPQENMFHVRGFAGTPLGGLSTLTYGRAVFGLSSAVNIAAAKQFANGLRPSLAVSTDQFLGDRRELIEEGINQKHIGAMNAGKPILFEAGLKPVNISFSPEDAQMLESRAFSVEEICRIFEVPPIMIGHGEKTSSWGTGVQEVTQGYVKYSLRRRLKRIEQAAEKQLLTAEDRAQGITIEFNLEGLLRGDAAARTLYYSAGLKDGWLNVNQVCKWENLPQVPGGDVNRVQMQNVPLTDTSGGGTPSQDTAA